MGIFSHFVHKRQKKCSGNPNLCIYVQGQFIIKNQMFGRRKLGVSESLAKK